VTPVPSETVTASAHHSADSEIARKGIAAARTGVARQCTAHAVAAIAEMRADRVRPDTGGSEMVDMA
jgi:hypothetical protein